MTDRNLTPNMERWMEAFRRGPENWITMPASTAAAFRRRGMIETMGGDGVTFYRLNAKYREEIAR